MRSGARNAKIVFTNDFALGASLSPDSDNVILRPEIGSRYLQCDALIYSAAAGFEPFLRENSAAADGGDRDAVTAMVVASENKGQADGRGFRADLQRVRAADISRRDRRQ